MKNKLIFSITIFLAVFSGRVYAQDWPQFLGPQRNSTSPETGILRSWPETGPEILWTANVERGYGGPVIKEGRGLSCLTGTMKKVTLCGVLILTMERNYGALVMMHQEQFHFRVQEVSRLSMATGSIPVVSTAICTALISTHINRYGTRTS